MIGRRGLQRALIRCMMALQLAVMTLGPGLHELTAHARPVPDHASFAASPDDRIGPLQAAPHDEGTCPICAGLSQVSWLAPLPAIPLGVVACTNSPGAPPVSASSLEHGRGDPRAPPRPLAA